MFQSLSSAFLAILEKSDNVVLLGAVMGFVKELLLQPRNPANPAPSLSDQVRLGQRFSVARVAWNHRMFHARTSICASSDAGIKIV